MATEKAPKKYKPKRQPGNNTPFFTAVHRTARIISHYKDWAYAEAQYALGTRSIVDIADEIGVTKADLFLHFSREKITKGSLADKIDDRMVSMLAADALPQNGTLPVTQEDIISINATLQASLILSHRQDVGRARKLVMSMLVELEYATDNMIELHELADLLRPPEDPDDKDARARTNKLQEAYHAVISLPGRVETLKKIGDALKILILLERQAFGIRDDYEDPKVRAARINESTGQFVDNSFKSISDKFDKILGKNQQAIEDAVIIEPPAENVKST